MRDWSSRCPMICLWQLADSAFPTGGVRALVGARGGVAAAAKCRIAGALRRFVRDALEQSGRGVLPLRQRGASRAGTARRARRARRRVPDQPRRQPREPRAGAGVCRDLRARLAVAGAGGARRAGAAGALRRTSAPVIGRHACARSACRSTTAQQLVSLRHRARRALGRRAARHRRQLRGAAAAARLRPRLDAGRRRALRRARRARPGADGAAARPAAGGARSPLLAAVSVLKGVSRAMVLASTIIRTSTDGPEFPTAPGRFRTAPRRSPRDYARARLHGRHRRPGRQRQDRAAARALPRAARRRTASPSSPTTSSRRRTPSSWSAPGAARRSASPRSRPAAARTRPCATTSARTSMRWSS